MTFGIISLFIISAITPIAFGFNVRTSKEGAIVESHNFDSYHFYEITSYAPYTSGKYIKNNDLIKSNQIDILKETLKPLDSPMDSPWPMCSHDVRHTGRSPYSTVNNIGIERWRSSLNRGATGGVVIDNDGVLYIGADGLYAIHFNGTLKWKFTTNYKIHITPAIDENGIIYFGTIYASPDYLYAVYTSNGTLKWKFNLGDHIFSSPAIGNDGTIYFGGYNGYFYALYSNGTVKWKYKTGDHILSSPVIGEDGTVYCGSHDHYLYAFHPENGTVKWKFPTGHYVRANPCIADDGTIYCVSRDSYLYAIYPNNGTMKWKTNVHAGTSPTIGQDGTIYAGWKDLYAINPTNGSVKWTFDVGGELGASTPCNSIEGTVYFGNYDGTDIVAVNSDGTEKWRKTLYGDIVSSPAIDEDGTVYIGSQLTNGGYLHAFGYTGPNPLAPTINGPASGKPGTPYTYTFTSIDPDEDQVSYYVEWGDTTNTGWFGPFASGAPQTKSHTWTSKGTYTIKAKAKDTDGHESDWGTLTVTMPRDKAMSASLFLSLLERFPLFWEVLSRLIPR